jgi:hypothetical protein
MEIVTQDFVKQIIEDRKNGEFSKTINKLKKGEALCISPLEWRKRTSIPHYFLGKYNRDEKTVSVLRVGDYYYVIRL